MPLSTKQQIIQTIKNAKNILIAFKNIKFGSGYPAGGDAVSSALALHEILQKNNKNIDIVSPEFSLPESLAFLPNAQKIKNSLEAVEQAQISINIKQSGVKDFSYRVDGDFLNIYLTPKEGLIDLKSMKTEHSALPYDLIITVDTPDLKLLGDVYFKNKFLFDNIPIINIDHSPQNENFGDINLVDIKNSSTAEIIWQILEDSRNVNANIIDCVLAGIIAKTKNFRRQNINPKTLEAASHLIVLGGRRNEIVDGFYRTKAIETLKLWGRALARLKQDKKVVWTLLTHADFVHSGATEDMLPDVIHELITNSYGTEIVVILYETEGQKIKSILYSDKVNLEIKGLDVKHVVGQLSYINLPYPNLISAERELMQKIKEIIN
ncbi:MAG: DHH family phosphoesterase [Patescibacteria group bacterium]